MLPVDRLEAELLQARAEAARHLAQVPEQRAALADDLQRSERGRGFAGRDRIRINVKGVLLAQVPDHGRVRTDVSAVDAEGLAERSHQHVRAPRGDLFGPAPARAEPADAV